MPVLPPRLLPLLLALIALPTWSCGPGATPRRDLVLVLAESSPESTSAGDASETYAALRPESLVLGGGLRRDETALPTPLELRIELFTSIRHDGYLESVNELLPHLPSALGRSGRATLGYTTPAGLVTERGFDLPFAPPGQPAARPLERLAASELPSAVRDGLDELAADYAERGVAQPSSFLMVDLAGGAPAALDELLAVLAPELETAHLFVYFTDPASPDRILIHGPGLPRGTKNDPVDPRDLFPTIARLGRAPVPGTVQGVDLLR